MTTTISRIKEMVDCRDLAAHYLGEPAARVGRAWQWFCPFHPDQATPSLTVYRDGYRCFGCGVHGDHFGLIMALEHVDFPAARERLEWNLLGVDGASTRSDGCRRPEQHLAAWRVAGWQWSAWQAVDAAARRLDETAGALGRAYLLSRGLTPATWRAWRLGYAPQVRRWRRERQSEDRWQAEALGPAITLPWTDGRAVKALQYRLISHPELRYWQKAGGERTLFGVHLLKRQPALVVCEGELNAVSIWQVAGDQVDVVSFGPQSNVERAAPYLRRLTGRYRWVVVWADEQGVAREVARVVGRQAIFSATAPETPSPTLPLGGGGSRVIALCSPQGMDANNLLVSGWLREFMIAVVAKAAYEEVDGGRDEA